MSIETTTPFLRGLEERRSRVERFLVAARQLRTMSRDERIEVIEDVIGFLADTLLPHADAAQRLLYGVAERPSVSFDQEEIRRLIGELADCEPRRTGRLQELLHALHLVASNHLQKEEEAYLRALHGQPGRMERVMEEIGTLAGA